MSDDKHSTKCPLIKDNPGICPFAKDVHTLLVDVKWLKGGYKINTGLGVGTFVLLAGFICKLLEVF